MKLLILFFVLVSAYCLWRLILQTRLVNVDQYKPFELTHLLKPTDLSKPAVIAKDPDLKEDIRMFDDVAKLMFEKNIKRRDFEAAREIQYEFLNKMPTRTRSQLNQFDLGEWSILWEHQNQSLEYYVSRYGVCYTHVDAKGVEHKSDFQLKV